MDTALLVIGCLMIAATAIPVARHEAWWVRVFDFPRVQITVVAAIVLVAYWLTADTPDTTDYLFLSALAASLALLRIMHDADPDIIPAVETDQW